MGILSGRHAFRVVREVPITRVEVVADFPDGKIITPGHKEPLHGWNLAQGGRVVSIEEIALPDEATLTHAPRQPDPELIQIARMVLERWRTGLFWPPANYPYIYEDTIQSLKNYAWLTVPEETDADQ